MIVSENKYMRVESAEIAKTRTSSETIYFVMDNNGRDYRSYTNKDTAIEYMNRVVSKGWKKESWKDGIEAR